VRPIIKGSTTFSQLLRITLRPILCKIVDGIFYYKDEAKSEIVIKYCFNIYRTSSGRLTPSIQLFPSRSLSQAPPSSYPGTSFFKLTPAAFCSLFPAASSFQVPTPSLHFSSSRDLYSAPSSSHFILLATSLDTATSLPCTASV